MKKLISVLLSVTMLIAFASCQSQKDRKPETTQQLTETKEYPSSSCCETQTESTVVSVTESKSTSSATATSEMNTEITADEADPSEWSAEEIIEFYKSSAVKSQNKVKSVQKMSLKELVVNDGDGALGKFVDFITPFFVSALEKNSTEFDGITGGYENLTVSDTSSVKAYKDGGYTVVEITLKEQTDGIHADNKSGSVGHAISVVGDISVVEKELPQFKIAFDKAEISLKYSNPKLRVKINKDGIIESGVWSYTVCISIENLRVDAKAVPIGATVDKGYGEVDYIIAVG